MKYRKKPVVVDASQWFKSGDHPAVCTDPVGGPYGDRTYGVMTPNGFACIEPGEWIITGTKGEVYPCKPDIFAEIYEPVVNCLPDQNQTYTPNPVADPRLLVSAKELGMNWCHKRRRPIQGNADECQSSPETTSPDRRSEADPESPQTGVDRPGQ